ncbi:MAG: hypothetical protein ACK45U_03110, partial [bacterium]
DVYLYPSDIEGIVPKGNSNEDSLLLVQSYIENWVRQTLLIKQAEENVDIDLETIDQQLENYKSSLLIYAYEQQLIAQKLDTTVTANQIKSYYEANKENFELKKTILKASYIKLPKNSIRIENAIKWFKSNKEKDKRELETYCMQFSPDYILVDTSWLYYDQLSEVIPLDRLSESSVLQNNNYIQISDKDFIYLVKVKTFMYKEDISPLEIEVDNIKNIIINKRKVEMIDKMENEVYKNARDNNDIEIFKSE